MSRFPLTAFNGVVPALFTPFTETGELDLERLRAITRHLGQEGIAGYYLTGSTGEGFMMSPEERMKVVETVVEENAGRLPVMVHVGAISTYHTAKLAEHAASVGSDAISAVPPIYWTFSDDEIVDYYRDVSAATDLPMVAYNVPMAAMGYDLLKRLAEIDGVAGLKYTAVTHFEIMRLKAEFGEEFLIFSGADEMAMSGLAFGADGIIGSFYNLMPDLYVKLFAAAKAGEMQEAKALQEIANAIIFETLSTASMGAMKRMMGWNGPDAGYVRAPHENVIGPEAEDALKARFRALKAKHEITGVKFLDTI